MESADSGNAIHCSSMNCRALLLSINRVIVNASTLPERTVPAVLAVPAADASTSDVRLIVGVETDDAAVAVAVAVAAAALLAFVLSSPCRTCF